MAISAYILKIVENDPFLRLQIRAKEIFNRHQLSVRTGNPLLWVSQNLPANEVTGDPPTVECKETKKSMGSPCPGVTKRIYRR